MRPTDKKLIGYLTWRWKREGYDWSVADGPKPSSNEEVDLAAKMDTISLEDSGSVETKSQKTVLVIGQDFSATIPTRVDKNTKTNISHLRFVDRLVVNNTVHDVDLIGAKLLDSMNLSPSKDYELVVNNEQARCT